MADEKISQLPTGTTPTGTELIPAVQAGSTVSLSVAQISPPAFSKSVSATLASTQNNYVASGSNNAGITRFLLAAAAGGSVVTGLNATGVADGTMALIYNTSTTDYIELPHLSGTSSAGNQFSCSQGQPQFIEPLSAAIIVYVNNVWIIAS